MEQGVKLILMESQVGAVHYFDGIFAREPGIFSFKLELISSNAFKLEKYPQIPSLQIRT